MITYTDTNMDPCADCGMQKWGIKLDEQELTIAYCTVCAGDYAHTKEARDAAEALNNQSAE